MSNSKRDLEKEQHWRELISQWQKSGLNKTQFCREHNLKLTTFCNWVSVIRNRDEEQRKERTRQRRQPANRKRYDTGENSSVEFVTANFADRAHQVEATHPAGRVEISTPDGFVIKLPADSHSSLLFALLQALR